ncbi:hypothetical protein X975_20908, partial [Stegodyphus mimosarum]
MSLKIVELKCLIQESAAYDEEFVKGVFEGIANDRLKEERRRKKDSEDCRARQIRHFELERLRIEAMGRSSPAVSENSGSSNKQFHRETQKIIQKFDSDSGDINLYLTMFERQAKRFGIEESDWIAYLLVLLPMEIVQFISKEPEGKDCYYIYVKALLLKRFKLSSEKFRLKFIQHQRRSDETWRNLSFGLRKYLDEWLSGLEMKDFEKLKDLMVTDQMKRRVGSKVKDHLLDDWSSSAAPVGSGCCASSSATMDQKFSVVRDLENAFI